MRRYDVVGIPFIRRSTSTRYELDTLLKRWSTTRELEDCRGLYLAFRGEPGYLRVESERHDDTVSLPHVAAQINKCADRCFIHFGSCSLLQVPDADLDNFLGMTGALSVSGYTKDVDFVDSAAFEHMLLTGPLRCAAHGRRSAACVRTVDERLRAAGSQAWLRLPNNEEGMTSHVR